MTDTPAEVRGTYEFGGFRLDARERVLSSSGGEPIALVPRAFDVLCHFVANAGRLLEKDELMRAIWPRVVVDENNLSQQVSAVRRALGDGRDGRRYVLTVPGRGYRFVAEVRHDSAPTAQPRAQARPDPPTALAVLPFTNLTGDPSVEYFSDGMADELINMLTRVPGLDVASRTSSFAYKGKQADVREIGRDLGVGLVLEGSVRKSAARIRVTAQLVRANTGYHVWSQTYERDFADLFELEDELVAEIVRSIGAATQRPLKAPGARPPPTRDVAAYELFLEARARENFARGGSLTASLELYERVLAIDPEFARAYCGRATARTKLMNVDFATATWETVAAIEADAQRALALDPRLAEAMLSLGIADALRWRWTAAEEWLRTAAAVEGGGSYAAQIHSAYVAMPLGHLATALQEARDAYSATPTNPATLVTLAVVHSFLALDTEAVEYVNVAGNLMRATTGAFPPPSPTIPPPSPIVPPPFAWVLSMAALRAGRFDEAGSYFAGMLPQLQTPDSHRAVRAVYAAVANPSQRGGAAAELRRLLVPRDPSAVELTHCVVVWFTVLGALDDAYAAASTWLGDGAGQGPQGLPLAFLWFPEMAPFRDDPRFPELCARLKFRDYWDVYGPPDGYELRGGKLHRRDNAPAR